MSGEIVKPRTVDKSALSRSHYVVRPAAGTGPDAICSALAGIAAVEPLESPFGGCVATLADPPTDSRDGCAVLGARLGRGYVVVPALVDDRGELRYPTGALSVRFSKPITDEELATFAQQNALEFVRRAKYTRNQATFRRLMGVSGFLPDVVNELRAASGLEAVWLDAESAYRRADA